MSEMERAREIVVGADAHAQPCDCAWDGGECKATREYLVDAIGAALKEAERERDRLAEDYNFEHSQRHKYKAQLTRVREAGNRLAAAMLEELSTETRRALVEEWRKATEA